MPKSSNIIEASTTIRLRWIAVSLLAALLLAGCGGTRPDGPEPTPTLDPLSLTGRAVFTSDCGSCHSIVVDTVIVGPSLAGIGDLAGTRVDGLDARAYLYTSILQPGAYIVDGFEHVMPENFGKKLTGEEIDGVVAYLMTLHN